MKTKNVKKIYLSEKGRDSGRGFQSQYILAIIYCLQSIQIPEFYSIEFENKTDFVLKFTFNNELIVKYISCKDTKSFTFNDLLDEYTQIHNFMKNCEADNYTIIFAISNLSKELKKLSGFIDSSIRNPLNFSLNNFILEDEQINDKTVKVIDNYIVEKYYKLDKKAKSYKKKSKLFTKFKDSKSYPLLDYIVHTEFKEFTIEKSEENENVLQDQAIHFISLVLNKDKPIALTDDQFLDFYSKLKNIVEQKSTNKVKKSSDYSLTRDEINNLFDEYRTKILNNPETLLTEPIDPKEKSRTNINERIDDKYIFTELDYSNKDIQTIVIRDILNNKVNLKRFLENALVINKVNIKFNDIKNFEWLLRHIYFVSSYSINEFVKNSINNGTNFEYILDFISKQLNVKLGSSLDSYFPLFIEAFHSYSGKFDDKLTFKILNIINGYIKSSIFLSKIQYISNKNTNAISLKNDVILLLRRLYTCSVKSKNISLSKILMEGWLVKFIDLDTTSELANNPLINLVLTDINHYFTNQDEHYTFEDKFSSLLEIVVDYKKNKNGELFGKEYIIKNGSNWFDCKYNETILFDLIYNFYNCWLFTNPEGFKNFIIETICPNYFDYKRIAILNKHIKEENISSNEQEYLKKQINSIPEIFILPLSKLIFKNLILDNQLEVFKKINNIVEKNIECFSEFYNLSLQSILESLENGTIVKEKLLQEIFNPYFHEDKNLKMFIPSNTILNQISQILIKNSNYPELSISILNNYKSYLLVCFQKFKDINDNNIFLAESCLNILEAIKDDVDFLLKYEAEITNVFEIDSNKWSNIVDPETKVVNRRRFYTWKYKNKSDESLVDLILKEEKTMVMSEILKFKEYEFNFIILILNKINWDLLKFTKLTNKGIILAILEKTEFTKISSIKLLLNFIEFFFKIKEDNYLINQKIKAEISENNSYHGITFQVSKCIRDNLNLFNKSEDINNLLRILNINYLELINSEQYFECKNLCIAFVNCLNQFETKEAFKSIKLIFESISNISNEFVRSYLFSSYSIILNIKYFFNEELLLIINKIIVGLIKNNNLDLLHNSIINLRFYFIWRYLEICHIFEDHINESNFTFPDNVDKNIICESYINTNRETFEVLLKNSEFVILLLRELFEKYLNISNSNSKCIESHYNSIVKIITFDNFGFNNDSLIELIQYLIELINSRSTNLNEFLLHDNISNNCSIILTNLLCKLDRSIKTKSFWNLELTKIIQIKFFNKEMDDILKDKSNIPKIIDLITTDVILLNCSIDDLFNLFKKLSINLNENQKLNIIEDIKITDFWKSKLIDSNLRAMIEEYF